MTTLLALVVAVLEILGIGVHPLDGEGRMTIARETVLVGDVLRVGVGAPLVAWCDAEAPPSPTDTRCFVTPVLEGGRAEASRRPVFLNAGLCGNSLLRLLGAGDGVVAATACSGRSGNWAWVELLGRMGESRSVPLPVEPLAGRDQLTVIPVPATAGGTWLVWIEAGAFDRDRRTARAIRLDIAGEPVEEAVELSEPGTVLGPGMLGSHLAAASLPGGGLAAAWRVARPGGGASVRLRAFHASGGPASAPRDLDSVLVFTATPLRLATDASGRITLSWWARSEGGKARLLAASFSEDVEPLVPVTPVSPGTVDLWPQIAAVGISGDVQAIAWADVDPETGEPRIAVRRWSPARGPLGLTTWIDGAVSTSWPFLELVPGDSAGTFTLYWKETVDEAVGGPTAYLRWRDLRVGR